MPSAEIIAIGSELLTPTKIDTNSLWLTEKLNDIGVEVMSKTIVGDDARRLTESIGDAWKRSEIVITTGGLGPTEDDITRKCAADAIGRKLPHHEDIEHKLRERFKAWGREMPEINKRQAYVVERSDVLPNPHGSAVGMLVEEEGHFLVVLPGPPRENQPMFLEHVMPRLRAVAGVTFVSRRLLRVSGLGESAVDEIAAPIYRLFEDVQTSILFNKSEVELHIAARAPSEMDAKARVDELAGKLETALGKPVFATHGETLEAVVGKMLTDRGETVAVAESCTGGLVAQRLTNLAGSSRYFLEGVVSYSNNAKIQRLNVPAELIDRFGAVSAECAEAMANGIVATSQADHGVSVTGIAGPEGGSDEKSVGTVFIGYAGSGKTKSVHLVLPGDRELIRWRTSQAALDYLRRQLLRK
ncbi:MAG: competence/damage-inducible protein A [Blastocatellia bacterium]|nr:competence/damage-inducible protein A [Blastocatellia bacterium]